MSSATAWNADGDVARKYYVPWGAMRKAFLTYNSVVQPILSIALNGVRYDFQKQAKEGLVVCGAEYSSVTFFLPDNREPMTAEQGESMTINSYFEMLGTTDYAVITAWDYFAKFVSALMQHLDDPNMALSYSIKSEQGITASGTASFGSVTTAKDFFATLYNTMSSCSYPLSDWMAEDGSVELSFSLNIGDETASFGLIIGRK